VDDSWFAIEKQSQEGSKKQEKDPGRTFLSAGYLFSSILLRFREFSTASARELAPAYEKSITQ